MKEKKKRMLALLQANEGFVEPERWINYGIEHNFQKIQAKKLQECPNCSARSLIFIGQYIYYSTLMNLLKCEQCGLVFSDTRLDPQVINSHFEQTYKDEDYFRYKRRRIFSQISEMVDRFSPQGGSILDIGGAKGHLMAVLKQRRPDLNLVLNDISKKACDFASSHYGLKSICGDVKALEHIPLRFDVVIMSDVIYYEPQLKRLWRLLPRLVSNGGTVIIRVPNKLELIRFYQFIVRLTVGENKRKLQDHIKFFNPEHLYVFSRGYLLAQLKKLGFSQVYAMPSELLTEKGKKFIYESFYYFSKGLWTLSFGKIVVTPSLLIIARKHTEIKRVGLPFA